MGHWIVCFSSIYFLCPHLLPNTADFDPAELSTLSTYSALLPIPSQSCLNVSNYLHFAHIVIYIHADYSDIDWFHTTFALSSLFHAMETAEFLTTLFNGNGLCGTSSPFYVWSTCLTIPFGREIQKHRYTISWEEMTEHRRSLTTRKMMLTPFFLCKNPFPRASSQ